MNSAPAGISEERSDYLRQLQVAIHTTHRCGSLHVCTELVHATVGERSWSGEVETFYLIGHHQAQRCYAWGFLAQRRFRAHAVLELEPVDSASAAVSLMLTPARSASRR